MCCGGHIYLHGMDFVLKNNRMRAEVQDSRLLKTGNAVMVFKKDVSSLLERLKAAYCTHFQVFYFSSQTP